MFCPGTTGNLQSGRRRDGGLAPAHSKSFPKRRGDGGSYCSLDDHAFAMKIAWALKSELKDRNSHAKLVAGWTGANERTVKNWILGRYAPCGRHLVVLARHSDQVLNAILLMAGRQDLLLERDEVRLIRFGIPKSG
jgi:hypothetical protein